MGINTIQTGDGAYRQIDDVTGNTVEWADGASRLLATKVFAITRTMTVDTNAFTLPAGAIPVACYLFWGTPSNAGTTATVSVGITGTDTYFVNAQDVKGTTGQQRPMTVTNLFATPSASAQTQVVAKYAETGSASNAGGPFYVAIDFYAP